MAEITLIHPGSPFLIDQKTFPPLGIMYLSSMVKKFHFSVECRDVGLDQTINNIESNIVGISFTTAQKDEAFEIARNLKGKTLIAGGAHPSHDPTSCIKKGFQFVIKGEADYQLPILDTQLLRKRVTKFPDNIIKSVDPVDINIIPFPDRDVLPIKDYKYLINGEPATTIMTSRSCPFSCSFCSKISSSFRMQSAYRTVNEIRDINHKYGFKAFMIFDDVFIADIDRLREIVWLLKGKDFIFRCFGRATMLTEEVCDLLQQMNVVEVGVGVESGSEEVLKKNMKRTSVEQNTRAINNLRNYGIRSKAFMIIGLPGESHKTIDESRKWIEATKPDDIDFSILQILPGSDIYKNPRKYDLYSERTHTPLWYKGTPGQYVSSSHTKELSADELIAIRDQFENQYKNKSLLR